MTHFSNAFSDEQGYEELKKHMRLSHDFSKDMLAIMLERADLEASYAKGLTKLAAKSTKAAKDSVGSLMSSWSTLCVQLGSEAESHKTFGEMLHEEVHKPLKISVDQQVKNRRTVEVTVDKAIKTLHDKQNDLQKAKKTTHTKVKESENLAVQLEDPTQRGKILSDKEVGKLRTKTKKAEEQATKADLDYLELIKTSERARHEMERTLVRAVLALESQELERISEQKLMLTKYSEGLAQLEPTLHTCVEDLNRSVALISPDGDIIAIANSKGKEGKPHDQLLYDSYEEDMSNSMNAERRRNLLERKVQILDTEIQKEQRAREGIAKLCGVYTETPSFADENAKQDVTQQLGHSNDMLNVLRASRFKIMAAKAFLDKQDKPEDDISNYIAFDKSKQGSRNSTLRIPKNAPPLSPLVEAMAGGRGSGDGHSVADTSVERRRKSSSDRPRSMIERSSRSSRLLSQDSFMSDVSVDEFDDSQGAIGEYGNVNHQENNDSGPVYSAIGETVRTTPAPEEEQNGVQDTSITSTASASDSSRVDEVIAQCRVLYDYEGQGDEELTIRENDMLNLYEKEDDGWWRGELNGTVGIFPGSYVEEVIGDGTDL